MADDDHRRAPSPPLPPEPLTRVRTNQGPAEVAQQMQTSSPSMPSREQAQTQAGLRRHDSLRSPPSVRTSSVQEQRQPIKDAVNFAASNVFQDSPVTNQMDPDIVKQITAQVTASVTEQVLKNLQVVNAAANATPTPTVQTQFPPPPPPQQWNAPRSPTRSSIDSNAERFTPPTPERNMRGSVDERLYESSSPEPVSDAGSGFSVRSRESQRSGDTPRPFHTDDTRQSRRSQYTSRRRSAVGTNEEKAGRQGSGSDSTARDRTQFRRDSREPEASYEGSTRSRARTARAPSEVEETTTLERIWQPLFDNGNPTMRLSQFLRGLALHIIDDVEPKGSIVVTPTKMLQFLNETKVEEEHYPWDIIFGGKLNPASISMMFQKLLCQHHLVQERYDRPPTVPGLTTSGFDYFMTCLIQAHPDTEFERLAKAVMNMPISNADNKSERFPKELSRRLLPAAHNIQAAQRLISSLNHEPYLVSSLKGTSAMPPPPPPPVAPPQTAYPNERERNPYSSTAAQQSNAVDDDDLGGAPAIPPIERERQPYGAPKEGAGKLYDDARPPAPSQYNKAEPVGGLRNNNNSSNVRPNSGLPPPPQQQQGYPNNGGAPPSEPVNIPQPTRHPHRMSTGGGPMPSSTTNGGGGGGGYSRRSPPRHNPYTRSEPEFVSSPSQGGFSNSHPRDQPQYSEEAAFYDDNTARRYRSRSRVERGQNNNDDDASSNGGRGYPISNRSRNEQSGTQNDEDAGSNGGRGYPIPGNRPSVNIGSNYEYGGTSGPPVGSFPASSSSAARRPTMPSSGNDGDRRRSMYAGNGGTDGYGSFAPDGGNGSGGYPASQQQPYGSSVQQH